MLWMQIVMNTVETHKVENWEEFGGVDWMDGKLIQTLTV